MTNVLIYTNKNSEGIYLDAKSCEIESDDINIYVVSSIRELIKYLSARKNFKIIYFNSYSIDSYLSLLLCLTLGLKIYYHIHDPLPYAKFYKKYFIWATHYIFSRLSYKVLVYGRLLKVSVGSVLKLKPSKIVWAYLPVRYYGAPRHNIRSDQIAFIGKGAGYKRNISDNEHHKVCIYNKYLNDKDFLGVISDVKYIGFLYLQNTMMSAVPATAYHYGAIPLFFSDAYIREPFARFQDLHAIKRFYINGDPLEISQYISKLPYRYVTYNKNSLKNILTREAK